MELSGVEQRSLEFGRLEQRSLELGRLEQRQLGAIIDRLKGMAWGLCEGSGLEGCVQKTGRIRSLNS